MSTATATIVWIDGDLPGYQRTPPATTSCTVTTYPKFALLQCFYPGCGVKPHACTFDTAENAKKAGEHWLTVGTVFADFPGRLS